MGFDVIQYYLTSGWRALIGQTTFNLSSLADLFNLVTLLDIVLLLLLLWWAWWKIRRTNLVGLLPKLAVLLAIMFLGKLLGFLAVFYTAGTMLVVVLISAGTIYQQDFKKILDGTLGRQDLAKRNLSSGDYDVKSFLTELGDTVTSLAKSKTPALLVVQMGESLGKMAENGTYLLTPFDKDFVLDISSRRSKLSTGAILIDKGMIIAAGSTLMLTNPKRFTLSLNNAAIQQVALKYEALVIITYKDKEDISLLHKDSAYAKLPSKNLDRVLKSILLG
ncbi:MAG: DNA integrity scanning protein DisA nucleotide-binding domain protein [Patescibacteria group bacterium]